MSKTNRGSGVLVMLRGSWRRGSIQKGRGQRKGRSPAAAHVPNLGPGHEGGGGSLWRLRPPGPRRSAGINGPASWPSTIPVILVNYNNPMKDCLIYHLRTWHSEQHNEFSYPNWITETLFSVLVFSYTKIVMLLLLFQNGKTSLKVRVFILRKTANRCKNSCG